MNFFSELIKHHPEFSSLAEAVKKKKLPSAVTGLSGVAKSHIISSLCALIGSRAIVVASDESEAQKITSDLSQMGLRALFFPYRTFNLRSGETISREHERSRLFALSSVAQNGVDCIVTCIDAAMQYTIPRDELTSRTVKILKGDILSPEELSKMLLNAGYVFSSQVEGPGQFSKRGGIFDLFPVNLSSPVRCEFFGDEIESISVFDIDTQRRNESVDDVLVIPASEVPVTNTKELCKKLKSHASSLKGKFADKAKELILKDAENLENGIMINNADKYISLIFDKMHTLFDFCKEDHLIFVSDSAAVKERLKVSTIRQTEEFTFLSEEGILCNGLDSFSQAPSYALSVFEDRGAIYLDTFARGSYDTKILSSFYFAPRLLPVYSAGINALCEDISHILTDKWRCVILAGSAKAAKTAASDLRDKGINAYFSENPSDIKPGCVAVTEGRLSGGIEYNDAKFSIISYGQNFVKSNKKSKISKKHTEVFSLSEVSAGDYVVHSVHGIGVFCGIHKIEVHGLVKDYIKIRYAHDDTLYVPVTQLDMVAKYIGGGENGNVKLHKLGGSEWQKSKSRVRAAVKDMAKELISLYSQRMKQEGFAFPSDTDWQKDFEAHFEYEETDDQMRCISEIKNDMELSVPMDRLLCGDVGFGKTEVALRAAFKCATAGKQCAILAPTTILAFQHYQTIKRRMENFPINIELLSRFRNAKEQNEIIKKVSRGDIDIIVGTHRLVSKDVNFYDLGLVIIDEEQRFGVAQKEHLKNAVKNVDVLTLSATPIPRTLNMALSGIRDMSVIEEAPQDRYPVETYVLEYDTAVITTAIRQELARGGQVYYVHNDIESLDRVANSIKIRIPDARIACAHGRMGENELSSIWQKLIDQEIDVLVCTTIIETGVDVPNVNTLIISNADKMGLSQLHQLRGRVGRSSRRAYAYFTFTKDKVLTEIAEKRLTAIREFTQFGSGFRIAMRDLEIRGAGNLLGGEQHGHMESVGYDMYMKLLEEAVKKEKGVISENTENEKECLVDIQIDAHIPETYIQSLNQRLEIYRHIASIKTKEDAEDVLDEINDRFGEIPKSVFGLVNVALLRNTAKNLGITEIKQNGKTVTLYVNSLEIETISRIMKNLRSRVKFGTVHRNYIAITLKPGESSADAASEVLSVMMPENS